MSNSLEGEYKLEGSSNYRAWKHMMNLILEKNKVFNLAKGKVKNRIDESSDAEKTKFREIEILAMSPNGM